MEEDTGVFNPVLLTQITRPQDCFLGIAIPLTLETAQRQFAAPDKYDFIPGKLSKPPDQKWWEAEDGYGDKIEKKIRRYLQDLRDLGVTIEEDFSLAKLSKIQHRYKVIAVMAHSPKIGEVELADGIQSAEAFAAVIPNDYIGIFHLINCWSTELQNAIKSARSQCLTIANKEKRYPDIAMFIYKHWIQKLATKEMTYLDGFKVLQEEFYKAQDDF